MADFISGLDAFADQFAAQLANAGAPSSEHAVHFCLALGFQATYDLGPGAIVFEWPVDHFRIDLAIRPLDLAIEVKYQRPIPSGRNLPMTQLYGGLLADFNKLALIDADNRLTVWVTDERGLRYLERSGGRRLPSQAGGMSKVTGEQIASLPETARRAATADGSWRDLQAHLLWRRKIDAWQLLAWKVMPISCGNSSPRTS